MLTAEALQHLRDLARQADHNLQTVDGVPMATVPLHDARPKVAEPKPLTTTTLVELLDYVRENPDGLFLPSDGVAEEAPLVVHVQDPATVSVHSVLQGPHAQRLTYVVARHPEPSFRFGTFYPVEEFGISLTRFFPAAGDRDYVRQLAGNLKDENVKNVADDGFSQQVTARAGIATVENVEVKNPVRLDVGAWTFKEGRILEDGRDLVECLLRFKGFNAALFEVDLAEWRAQTMAALRAAIRFELTGCPHVVVL